MVDLAKIKQKLNELQNAGGSRGGSRKLWKPQDGTHMVRVLPYSKKNGGDPFVELFFYYFINPACIAPYKMGKPDPVREFQMRLYEEGSAESKALAKKLWPKDKTYAPIIVRGKEDQGVLWFGFNRFNASKLYEKFVDGDFGDITDPETGFDVKVIVSQPQGRMFKNIDVEVRPKSSPLASSLDEAKKIVDSIPDLMTEVFADRFKTYEEIKSSFEAWMASGARDDRTDAPARAQDQSEAKAERPVSKSSPASSAIDSIDKAFDDLLGDSGAND